jgi:hypothetical protein
MKANAPEKIYYAPYGDMRENHPITDNDIEYVRIDAFIEKAVKFLKDRVDIPYDIKTNGKGEPYADSYIDYATKRIEAENKFIEDFKKAMKL